jgi:hypothetical protein
MTRVGFELTTPGLEQAKTVHTKTASDVQWLRLTLSKGSNRVGVFSPFHLRTETDPVSETSCFYSLDYRTIEKVQKPSNFVCYTPSPEPLEILYNFTLICFVYMGNLK